MAAGKKYKLFKICKELNLGHETIISFLEQKGIKVAGPNASLSEDVYLDIVERFATDKEKAERLRSRRGEAAPAEVATETEAAAKGEEKSSAYMNAIRKSIEDKAEELSKPEKKKPAPKPEKPKPVVEKREEKPEEPTPEIAEEKAEPPKKEKEPAPLTPEEIAAREMPFEEPRKEVKEQEAEAEEDLKQKGKKKKPKEKGEEEQLSEKERKRLKALEMIRKDGKKRAAAKPDLRGGDEEGQSRRKKKKSRRRNVDMKEVQDNVKKTLASIESKGRKPKKTKKIKQSETDESPEDNVIEVTEFISANDLASLIDVPVAEIIAKCLDLGLMVSINQRLDIDTISLLADEYGYQIKESKVSEFVADEEEEVEDKPEDLEPRPPVVTIMGHVDHGKTSLLDHLRHSNIVGGEAGGITQHVGAYEVEYNDKKITFLDTPGHEAFTAMRARGAQVTDIVILVIAADDAVMPQTDEALDHAKAAGVKIVIAINKIDKPGANSERIRQQLAERNVLVEDWGGQYQCAEISAKTGKGIPELLEKVLLESEMLELKANPRRPAGGFVVESRLDRGKGPIATVLVQNGTLEVGDSFIAGQHYGRVRALLNEREEALESVRPGQPALVTGFMGVPQAGDKFLVKKDERTVREISSRRQQLKREQDARKVKQKTLASISEKIKAGEVQELNILVKADVDGSAEALADALIKLNTEEVAVNVVRKAVGPISESDVLLAAASEAVIIGFHVRANPKAKELAEKEEVDIHNYRVVYDAINDVKMALEGLLSPHEEEVILGQLEVRETFKISRVGTIAGCYVTNGKVNRNNKVRIIRDDVEIYNGNLASLKRFKDDVKEVASGFECGIQIENYNDLKVGDIIESYEIAKTKRTLETA